MKKRIYIGVLLVFTVSIYAQQINRIERRTPEVRQSSRLEKAEQENKPPITIHQQRMHEEALWERIIYRELDLSKAENTPLYYPERPLPAEMNLFCILLEGLIEKRLAAYEYIDGYEVLEETYLLSLKEILTKCDVYYEKEEEDAKFLVDKMDYPSREVRAYYVKERWFLSQRNSILQKEIVAICPLLSLVRENALERLPLFWIKYDDLYPFIKDVLIMTSAYNNVKRYTLDEYFILGMYEGEIIKVAGPANKTLLELHTNPDSLKIAQEEIERELNSFKKSLSWYPDSVNVSKKQIKKEQSATSSEQVKPVRKQERPIPTRSVRRR